MNDLTPTDWRQVTETHRQKRERGERDAQQIGDLTRQIVDDASSLGSIRKLPSPSSGTTGAPCPDQRASSSTGKQLSTIDAASLLAVEQAWQERDSDRLESTLHRSLKPLRTSSLQSVTDSDFNLLGYERIGPIDESTRLMLADVAARITEPSTGEHIAGCAARCLAMTKSRDPGGLDVRAMIAGFVDELGEFPPDAVATAFRKHARQEKWWPSLSEIRDQCQRATRWRRSLKKALE